MTTGYFAKRDGQRGKVHVVLGIVPVCRKRPPDGFYQECGRGIHQGLIECRRCLRWVRKESGGDG